MFGRKYRSLNEKYNLDDPKADYKEAKRVGQYRVSSRAIYKADDTYLPFEAVKEVIHDQTSVHVSGCCAGGVMVERIIMVTEEGKYPFLFDTVKEVDRVKELIGV